MSKEDKKILCVDCNREFIWTAAEQAFFEKKGFKEIPKRCPDCRKFRKTGESYEVKCSVCGKITKISFAPDPNTVWLCEDCTKKRVRGE